jgi:hypothetical protein
VASGEHLSLAMVNNAVRALDRMGMSWDRAHERAEAILTVEAVGAAREEAGK